LKKSKLSENSRDLACLFTLYTYVVCHTYHSQCCCAKYSNMLLYFLVVFSHWPSFCSCLQCSRAEYCQIGTRV